MRLTLGRAYLTRNGSEAIVKRVYSSNGETRAIVTHLFSSRAPMDLVHNIDGSLCGSAFSVASLTVEDCEFNIVGELVAEYEVEWLK